MNKRPFSQSMKLLLGLAMFASVSAYASDYLYDLPFKGENFADNEKLFTRLHAQTESQKYGFDISARRYDFANERWTSLVGADDDFKNESRVAYNKPIYAMRGGVVEACWRNAPENPRPLIDSDYLRDEYGDYQLDSKGNKIKSPDRLWINWRLRDVSTRTIPKAGNHVIIKHDDGSFALYAHMITGSISADICPNNFANYTEAGLTTIPENDYPTVTQVFPTRSNPLRINKGDKIGNLGNSGESTGPHVHVHVEMGDVGEGVAEPINFRRGIASLMDNNSPYGNWQSFAGEVIPTDLPANWVDGLLFWAPRTLTSQYVRHGFNSAGYSALFKHLVDSGFKLNWFDAFTAGSTTRFNQIWTPANIQWRAYSRQTSAGYQTVMNQAKADGYVPVQVDSYSTAAGVRYAVVFEKKALDFIARHGLTYSQHMDVYNEAISKGMSPVNISVVSTGGQRRYTVLYHKKSIGAWSIRSQMTSSAYNTTYADMKANGKYPVYLNAYMHDGTAYYSAVFASQPVSSAVGAKHGLTSHSFQTYFNSYSSLGYSSSLITGLDGSNSTSYSGVWRK